MIFPFQENKREYMVCSVNVHRWQLEKIDKLCKKYGITRSDSFRTMIDFCLQFYDDGGKPCSEEESIEIFEKLLETHIPSYIKEEKMEK